MKVFCLVFTQMLDMDNRKLNSPQCTVCRIVVWCCASDQAPKKDNFLPTPWRCHLLRTWISVPFQKIRKTIFPSQKIQRKGFQIQLRTKLWFKVDSIIYPFKILGAIDEILIIVFTFWNSETSNWLEKI